MGAFHGSSIPIADGLDPQQFKRVITDLTVHVIQSGGELVVAVHDGRPLGLIGVTHGAGDILFPHAVWFSWASARNRMVAALRVLQDLRDSGMVLITVHDKEAHLFKHLCKYGVLRQVGVIRYYDRPQSDLLLFDRSSVNHCGVRFIAWKKITRE